MEQRRFKPYPIALTHLTDALCVVVGGGAVAARKIAALLESGARVRVISPALHEHLVQLRHEGRIEHVARAFADDDVDGATLAIAATNRREVNAQVAQAARERKILCNIADDPAGSSFHTLGTVARGDVLLSVSTGGESPALAAFIRRKLEATFGPEYGVLAERFGELRRELGGSLPPQTRAKLWRTLVSDQALAITRDGDHAQFDDFVQDVLRTVTQEQDLKAENSATTDDQHMSNLGFGS